MVELPAKGLIVATYSSSVAEAPPRAIPWPQGRQIPKESWRPPADHVIVSADDHLCTSNNPVI